jgi:hypothetical protein
MLVFIGGLRDCTVLQWEIRVYDSRGLLKAGGFLIAIYPRAFVYAEYPNA